MSSFQTAFRILYICQDLLREALRFLLLLVGAKASLAAEVQFLRKQLPGGPPFHAFCEGWELSVKSAVSFGLDSRLVSFWYQYIDSFETAGHH